MSVICKCLKCQFWVSAFSSGYVVAQVIISDVSWKEMFQYYIFLPDTDSDTQNLVATGTSTDPIPVHKNNNYFKM